MYIVLLLDHSIHSFIPFLIKNWYILYTSTAGELDLKTNKLSISSANLGLKELFKKHDMSDKVLSTQFCEALAIVQATTSSGVVQVAPSAGEVIKKSSCRDTKPMDAFLLKIVKKHGDRILLKESDREPKTSKKKRKKQLPINGISREKHIENFDEWQGTAPWDPLLGGDGCPKFLCDVMVCIINLVMMIWYPLFSNSRNI